MIAAGPPSRIVEEAIDGRLHLVLPDPVMDELERILSANLNFDSERGREVEAHLSGLAVESVPAPPEPADAVTGDPDDDLILACAASAEVEVLVTADRQHLLPLVKYRNIRILTPQALLAELRE